jgi:hypothetical protein
MESNSIGGFTIFRFSCVGTEGCRVYNNSGSEAIPSCAVVLLAAHSHVYWGSTSCVPMQRCVDVQRYWYGILSRRFYREC